MAQLSLLEQARIEAPERTDEVVWDAANRRIYVAGGEGYESGYVE